MGVSDPSLALSTFLLHHLPITKEEHHQQLTSGDHHGHTKPATAYLSLPLEDGSCCTVHAALVRNSLNTITAVLMPEVMLVNECPWQLELIELILGDDEEEEGSVWDGKVLVGVRREKKTVLRPSDKAVCVRKQVN